MSNPFTRRIPDTQTMEKAVRDRAAVVATWHLGKTFQPSPGWMMIGARGITRPVRALSDVTLEVESGQVFGLLGPNGAGKTTLMKVLATLVLPSEGRAAVLGADVVRDDYEVRRMVGLTTGDERSFYWRLTGKENLEFFAGLRGLSSLQSRRSVDAALEFVGLVSSARDLVGRYSTGMRQRLTIARALLGDPPLLMLDEPTRSLDPEATDQVRALLRALARNGRTILIATHSLAEATAVCDRVAIVAAGKIRRTLPVPSDEGEMRQAYGEAVHDADSASDPGVS